jgi:hypothetical protein
MKIRILQEDFKDIPTSSSDDLIKRWNEAGPNDKGPLVQEIINTYGKPSFKNISKALTTNMAQLGINPTKNEFLPFLDKLRFEPTADQDNQFKLIHQLYSQGKLNLTHDYLTRKTTYDESDLKNFQFILNVFDIVNDPAKLSKYFKDSALISEEGLYVDGKIGGSIKPVGNRNDEDTSTLAGTMNSWSGQDGENNVAQGDAKQGEGILDTGDYSIIAALTHQGIKENNIFNALTSYIKGSYHEANKIYTPKISNANIYKNMLSRIFVPSTQLKPKTQKELAQIKANNRYRDMKSLEASKHKDGDIAFVEYEDFQGGNHAAQDMQETNILNSFFIKQHGEWVPYEKDKIYSGADYRKYRNALLKSTVVPDKTSIPHILAGTLKVLDSPEFKEIRNAVGLK